MPRKIELLSSNSETLKVFFTEFLAIFETVMEEWNSTNAGDAE